MTKQVRVTNALRYSTKISGTFVLCGEYKDDPNSKLDGFVWVVYNGAKSRFAVNRNEFEYVNGDVDNVGAIVGEKDDTISDEDLNKDISDRFNVLSILVDGVVSRSIKSMIISGAPGIGKTFVVDKKLLKAKESGEISKFSMMTGSCTPIGLYIQLWNHKDDGDVLVLDDIDSIFGDQESLNLLKGALDTGRERQISWLGASKFLQNEGIDNTFEFNGTVIFISNCNFDKMISQDRKLSPHYAALVSRCVYLDLGIHSKREILIRINQVVENTTLMQNLRVSETNKQEILDWMNDNMSVLRNVSIRTIIQLASFIRTSPMNWKTLAKVTLIGR